MTTRARGSGARERAPLPNAKRPPPLASQPNEGAGREAGGRVATNRQSPRPREVPLSTPQASTTNLNARMGHGRGTGSAVEVRPEVRPEVGRSWPEVGSNLARSCTDLDPKLYRFRPEVVPIYTLKLVPVVLPYIYIVRTFGTIIWN